MAESDPQKEIEEPYELPDGWVWTTLQQVCTHKKGKKPNDLSENKNSNSLGYITIEAFETGFPKQFTKDISCPICKTFDILVVWDGARCGLSGRNISGVIGSTINALSPIKIDSDFLYQFVTSNYRLINQNPRGTGLPHVEPDLFWNLPFPLPPLPEQHRIVTKLETLLLQVNRSKDHLAKVPPLIKRFRQSVLAAACSGRLTEDWRREHPDVEPASELLNRIQEERIRRYEEECRKAEADGKRKPKKRYDIRIDVDPENHNEVYLPSTWKAGYINDIGNVCNGSTPSRKEQKFWKGDIPWISSGEVANNMISSTREKITEIGFKNASLRLLPKGTVLLAMIGEGKTRGQSAILNIEATINQNIAAILIDHFQLTPRYLQSWFQFQYLSTRETGSGSGPKALNCQRVRNIPFNLPPLPEQHAIVERLETLFHFADEVEQRVAAAITHANHLTQSLLAKAFRGELVPQYPRDEPASVLRERIKQARAELKAKKKTQRRKSKTMLDFN